MKSDNSAIDKMPQVLTPEPSPVSSEPSAPSPEPTASSPEPSALSPQLVTSRPEPSTPSPVRISIVTPSFNQGRFLEKTITRGLKGRRGRFSAGKSLKQHWEQMSAAFLDKIRDYSKNDVYNELL